MGVVMSEMTYKRKEVIGDCTLYLGDCRQVLWEIEGADTVMTDPVWPNCPASIGDDNFLPGGDRPYELFSEAMLEIDQKFKRLVIVMRSDSDPRFLDAIPQYLPFFKLQILPYVMPGYIGRKLGGDEIAYCFGEPIPSVPGKRVVPTYAPKIQPEGRPANGHPCSRALKHFEWLINWWSIEGETILDPFMGSGTTGVACAKMNRKFIGIEIEEKYFDIACRRIEESYKQPDLFIESTKAVQDVMEL